MEESLTDAIRSVEASSAAWQEEQRRFHKLAASVRTVEQAIKRRAGSLADVSHVHARIGSAVPRLVQQTTTDEDAVVPDESAKD